jgi:intein/homing endonuclease
MQDAKALRTLISTPVTFRAVTPKRFWDAETAVEVADVILGVWFGPDKKVTDITWLATDTVGDVEKVSYRLRVDLESGPSVIEQVIYYTGAEGQIVDLRLVCSGFRPV